MSAAESDAVRDELPADLDAAGFVGPYQFPDNSRRRIPGIIYLALAGVVSITSGWRMHVDEKQALVAAQQAVGFPVGHASAQQVWHGVRSRPTWRVLCYSAEEPPRRRGLVLVDAVDGRVVEHLVEDNPESSIATA